MSLKARTSSSSYSMSAALWRATIRQNRQSVTPVARTGSCIIARRTLSRESRDGNVSEVQAAPVRTTAVVLDQRPTHGARDLHHLGFEERRRAEGSAPRDLVGEAAEEVQDSRHPGDGDDAVVGLARIAQIVADPAKQFVVVRGAAHLPAKIPEVLDEQVAGAVLANLEIITARVDAAEDARKPRHEEVV